MRSQRLLREARSAIESSQPKIADEALDRARSAAGEHPEYLRLLGITRHMQKRRQEAVEALRRASERQPSDALILTNLGSALRGAGQFTEARAALHKACQLAPDLAPGWYNLGRALAAAGRLDEAADAYQHALDRDPDYAQARMGLAELFRSMRRFDRAASEYRRVIEKSPRHVRAWERLVNLSGIRLGDQEIAALERLQATSNLDPDDRIRIGFALGKVLDDTHRFAEAFTVFSAANTEKRCSLRWDSRAFNRHVESIIKTFDTPPKTNAEDRAGGDIVFIVGLPHSGTALVNQILASHTEVEGSTELSDLGLVLNEESRRLGIEYSQWAPKASANDWQRLGEAYLERTQRWHAKGGRLIDKSLSNWRFVGAINAMLPGARVINCRRDPVETSLACYHSLFARGREFSYDIPELGTYWRDYDRLMRFWLARYPHRIVDLHLEDLLAAPDAEIRQMLVACKLPFDQACMRYVAPTGNVRAIGTGKAPERLRGPRNRAFDYAPLLLPLRAALGADMGALIASLKDAEKTAPASEST